MTLTVFRPESNICINRLPGSFYSKAPATPLHMKAVIYCRVSSKEQVEGTSLDSQLLGAEEYARAKGILISKVFIEEGESAKFADRTKLLELLDYCKHNKEDVDSLIVWKVDRLARNVADHYSIKATLARYGVEIVSVTEPIDSKPEGKLMETMLAGFAEFDNEIRAMRCVQGMKRKILEGIFPWKPPVGYKSPSLRREKKTRPDEPDQPLFELLQRAWNEYATGSYTKAEILRKMQLWGMTNRRGARVTASNLDFIFRNPYYAGIIVDPWSKEECEGLHVPMVSRELFAQVQQVVKGKTNSQPHTIYRKEFPVRAFARCTGCQRYLTGAFCTGRNRRHPYYYCIRKGCSRRYKSLPVKHVDDEFKAFLGSIGVDPDHIAPIIQAIRGLESGQAASADRQKSKSRVVVERLNNQIKELIRMRAEQLLTDAEFLDSRASLLVQRDAATATLTSVPGKGFKLSDESTLRSVYQSLYSPLQTWEKLGDRPADQARFARCILPVGFLPGRIRTAERTLLFRPEDVFVCDENSRVHPPGLEPGTGRV
jgi:site-specific DNA recombinase